MSATSEITAGDSPGTPQMKRMSSLVSFTALIAAVAP
jgi:hypothetical protein